MKLKRTLILAALAAFPFLLEAQSYSLARPTIAGGGGTITGGVYSITGIIGQPVIGAASGGNFSVQSGFWDVVQTPGAPLLRITRTGANAAIISWPVASTGWVLQQSPTLGSGASWTDVASPPVVVVGGETTVTFSPASDNRFFRLRHP